MLQHMFEVMSTHFHSVMQTFASIDRVVDRCHVRCPST